ncbi:hypothetical protein QN277_007407 [Acacia crassicarpa]|uniref:3'-5' exonuclease domain-containing protein n=1 Tax=Acacia crassicarpa TaxID=499986 RepID=A0AAE1MFC8_9FABA|nr:hypothetical protein QN277_007407 [Acacia crassicarpa]
MAFTIEENAAPASHRLFKVNFDGTDIDVTVTHKAAAVARWISRTNSRQEEFHDGRLVVGLGVQWTPGGPADTLQLCVGDRCLVYQLRNSDNVPGILRRFLMDPRNTFVGFWNNRDRRKLKISGYDLDMLRNPLDMRKYVQTANGERLKTATIERIVEECLGITGVRISREINMSNWGNVNIRVEQVLQVTLDAHFAFIIGRNIRAWTFNKVSP